ncbi:cysteine desulfurase [Aquabacterium sp. A7-Y]|uniref:cysteine desulfurase n=1 Tax=Aquabacterium sp. A7-Y TaxID=1349605 RepID=UPI00223DF0D1|nr:cysteine desulfurase [Aquabacterium sp. A7-Y]MCW7541001.1 cysteine desulfurase [Aquabacterium sp. A7-Y]
MEATMLRGGVSAPKAFDVYRIREDFPILQQQMCGHPLVYLDNAASSQTPKSVNDRMHRYQSIEHANVHRSVHTLGTNATAAFEGARKKVAAFINAASEKEIVFTRGSTDSVNLVMHSFGRKNLKGGDEIVVTGLEHHSNIVPWQMLCEEVGAVLRVVPVTDAGELNLTEFERLLNRRTRLVAMTQVSNAIGTVNPVQEMVAAAKKVGAVALIDGAQAAPHLPVDVRDLGCDFYLFSGHKMCGPTGIGVLYAKQSMHERMGPYLGGGDMILRVTFEKTIYNVPPHKFEAGTPPIAAAIGLSAAIDYLQDMGMTEVQRHESGLLEYALGRIAQLGGVRVIGTAKQRASVISFMVGDIHPHDVGSLLNGYGIAIRAGHHCAQPVMDRFDVPATARASFALYNTADDVDALIDGIRSVQRILGNQ